MEEETFVANSKDVRALGVKISCGFADLHIYVNNMGITKTCSSRK